MDIYQHQLVRNKSIVFWNRNISCNSM